MFVDSPGPFGPAWRGWGPLNAAGGMARLGLGWWGVLHTYTHTYTNTYVS